MSWTVINPLVRIPVGTVVFNLRTQQYMQVQQAVKTRAMNMPSMRLRGYSNVWQFDAEGDAWLVNVDDVEVLE